MNDDPIIAERLAAAVRYVPVEVERRLEALHARSRSRVGRRRAAALATAAAIGIAAVVLTWRLAPRADHSQPVGRGIFSGINGWVVISDVGLEAIDPATSSGSSPVVLTHPPSGRFDVPMSWSSDGTTLLFARYATGHAAGGPGDLFLLDQSGRLTHIAHGSGIWGSVSPDATRVVYQDDDRTGGGLARRIFVVNVDGGTPRLVAGGFHAPSAGWPTWSPDGTRIAYLDRARGIVIVRADGTGVTRRIPISDPRITWMSGLAWSPDGSRFALIGEHGACASYVCYQRGITTSQVFVMGLDGTGLTQITGDPQFHKNADWCPSWSPDGKWIAYLHSSAPMFVSSDPQGSARHVLSNTQYGFAVCGIAWNPSE
jgi:WD40 repeat protein